jgi:glycosyltransferase involved in cell wall biosynthesis
MQPFFSICIPQYSRTSFLLLALQRLKAQTFRDFEVCIADDRSPDGRQQEVIDFLSQGGFAFRFEVNATNLRYDGNLRASIALSKGKYCVLMGNDDGMTNPDVLSDMHALLQSRPQCGVLICNYYEQDGSVVRRIRVDGDYPGTPQLAASVWRDFSFISGIVMAGDAARSMATDRFDGTEYYQLYLGSRLLSMGMSYCATTKIMIDKDLAVPGEEVDSYNKRPKAQVRAFSSMPSTQAHLIRLVSEGIGDAGTESERRRARFYGLFQLYCFTMPYWLFEYRRIQSWAYASALGMGQRPTISAPFALGPVRRACAWGVWLAAYAAALVIPTALFFALKPGLHRIAKFFRPRSAERGVH